jgi:glycosyltransferase involved in cell wall biosynthesis
MADNPLISVIIPTFNRADFLQNAIESVLAQTYKQHEIVVVDDGSTDNTKELIVGYGNKIRFYYQRNKGPAIARNYGVQNSSGDLLAFLDSDDVWHADKLTRQVDRFAADKDLALLFTGHRYVNHEDNQIMWSVGHNDLNKGAMKKAIMTGCPFALSSAMVKRQVFCKVGMFSEQLTYAEDWDLFFRIASRYDVDCIKEILLDMHVHKNSMVAQSGNDKDNVRLLNEIKVLDIMYSDTKKSLSSISMKNKAMSNVFLSHGDLCRNNNQLSMARSYFIRAALHYPFVMRPYVSLIKSAFAPYPLLYGKIKHLFKKGELS